MEHPKSQYHLRLPVPVYEQVQRYAEASGVSMNTFIVDVLATAVPLTECSACGGTGKVPDRLSTVER